MTFLCGARLQLPDCTILCEYLLSVSTIGILSKHYDNDIMHNKVYCHLLTLIIFLDVNKALPRLHKFITGSNSVTPLGAESHIILKFKHGCPAQCKCRPTAATCDPSIRFPMHYSDSDDLEQALDTALEEYFGFGFV